MSNPITWREFGDGLAIPTMTQGGGSLFPLGVGASCDGVVERGIHKMLREGYRQDTHITVQDMIDGFAAAGIKVRDEAVRETVRHMVMDHLEPICTDSSGFWLAKSPADFKRAQQHIRSRIARLQERLAALEEVEAVCVNRDAEPLRARWHDTLGVSRIMAGLIQGNRGRRAKRHRELADENRAAANVPVRDLQAAIDGMDR